MEVGGGGRWEVHEAVGGRWEVGRWEAYMGGMCTYI